MFYYSHVVVLLLLKAIWVARQSFTAWISAVPQRLDFSSVMMQFFSAGHNGKTRGRPRHPIWHLASSNSTLTFQFGEHFLDDADRTLFAGFRQIDNKLDTVLFPANDSTFRFEVVIEACNPVDSNGLGKTLDRYSDLS